MGINTDIRTGVYDHLLANGITNVAFPNVDFDESRPYYRIAFLPAQTQSLGLKTIEVYSGFIQIDIVITEGVGEIVAVQLVDSLLDLFPRDLRIIENTTVIEVNEIGWESPAIQEPNGYFIPVSIPYQVIN